MMPCQIFLIAAAIITNISQLANTTMPGLRYRIEGIATFSQNKYGWHIAIEDGNGGAALIENETANPFRSVMPGDIIRVSGRTAIGSNKTIRRNSTEIETIGHIDPPPPLSTSIKDLVGGGKDNHFVRIEATLRDVFHDELGPNVIFLALQDGGDTIICYRHVTEDNAARFRALIGARLEVTGVCIFLSTGPRICVGRALLIDDENSFRVLDPPPKDDFDVPGIDELVRLDPSRIAQSGRCRAVGTVIATWGKNKLLIKDNWARLTEVELADENLPPYKSMVEVVGLPASNLFRVNLLRAKWRKVPGTPLPAEMAVDVSAKSIFTDNENRPRYNPSWYGCTIRIRGTVKAMMSGDYSDKRFLLESDSFLIPVDATPDPSAIDRVKIGFGVDVAGVCIMEGSNWSPYSAFPQIHGMTLVVRSADDIRIMSRPSWWTPGRLLIALGILLAILGGILSWNILLHNIVKRREDELKREIFAHVNSDMKMRERNNLSIELHDSLSQGLTGVSLEIDSARRLTDDPAEMERHLGLAAKTLKSCRNELRTCIYDLRSNALGDCDMNESIRRALAPFIDSTILSVRFNVPRKRMSDNIAHNILRIIGELAMNAVRHGHATAVKVAGSIDRQTIRFSVSDNGCGFDPENCPGSGQGHFGLQGIRERLKRLNGGIAFESGVSNGAKAIVTIQLPEDETPEDG